MNNTKNRKSIFIGIAAFVLPIILMLLVSVMEGFYPFGETSILVADMKIQFVDYIGYMKNIFFGNDDFLYSFSKTFGGDMTGFAAYYLFNPFFLILLLFPNSHLPAGILFIVILMSGFAGLTFHIMLKEVNDLRFASLIFSTSYAMMGYFVAYVNCIHYFFSIIMLPLVIAGLYRTYKSEKISLLYVFSVALCVCSNYYIGYMVLIFTAAFFLSMLVADIESLSEVKEKIHVAVVVLYTTILGVLISCFSLLSVYISLKGQKSTGLSLSLHRNFHIYEFFSGLYVNAFHGNISDGLPIIYCGIIPVVFIYIFFISKNIKLKQKLCVAFLMLFMLAGFYIDGLNVAWHGFAHPIGFPYRNSFLFSFLILFYGFQGFLAYNKGIKAKYANYLVIVFFVYSALLILTKSRYVNITQVMVTALFLILSLIIIIMLKNGRKYIIPAIVGIIILESLELSYNAYCSIDAYFDNKADEENTERYFADFVESQQEIVNSVVENDNSFFRMDKLYRRDHNDAMLIGYNGLSHFSSCETDTAKRFVGKLGFRDNGLWAFYSQGSTAFAESFMGMKYMLSQYDETSKPYERINYINDRFIYKNPYALSLGFEMQHPESINMEEEDLFVLQNNIASSFTDNDYSIYEPVKKVDVELENITVDDGIIYRKTDVEKEAYIEYTVNAEKEDFIFMYFDAPSIQSTSLYIDNDLKAPLFDKYDWCIRECGHLKPGENITVRVVLDQDEIEIDNVYFYYENKEVLNEWYQDAANGKSEVQKITSSHLIFNTEVNNEESTMVFTIPYDTDWHVKLDGNKIETKQVMNSLLAIDVKKGSHIIEMQYIPRGLLYGSIISAIGLITTFCVYFLSKSKTNTRKKLIEKKVKKMSKNR